MKIYTCVNLETLEVIWDSLLTFLYSVENNTDIKEEIYVVFAGDFPKYKKHIAFLNNNYNIKVIYHSLPYPVIKMLKSFDRTRVKDMQFWESTLLKMDSCFSYFTEGHIIISDNDMVFTHNFDMKELEQYKTNLFSACLCNSSEEDLDKCFIDWAHSFNSGFFICNTDEMKKHKNNFYQTLEEMLRNGHPLYCYDETVINYYLKNKHPDFKKDVKIIPEKYNKSVICDNINVKTDAVLHFQTVKPWLILNNKGLTRIHKYIPKIFRFRINLIVALWLKYVNELKLTGRYVSFYDL